MRIAIDSNVFTMQKYGGVSRYLVRLSEELITSGNEVEVFGWLHTNRHLAQATRPLTRMRYIERFPRFTRRLAHHAGDLIAGRQLSRWGPDLIHESFCHNRRVGPQSLPRVCTIHDMIHELFPEYWGGMDRTPEYRKATIGRCNAVICVSESTRKDLLGLVDVAPEKVHVIHHGFEHIGSTRDLDPREAGIVESIRKVPYLLYVGARHGYKNFERLLRGLGAARLQNELRLVAFGGGPLTQVESGLMLDLGIPSSQVVQIGGSDAVLERLFRSAEAFVYPSVYEGFGFPPLEAMAEGCPVLSSNTSSMPEVIGDAAEYFNPVDVDSIAKALAAVVGNSARRSELAALGQQRLKYFSWSECARKTLDVYRLAI